VTKAKNNYNLEKINMSDKLGDAAAETAKLGQLEDAKDEEYAKSLKL